MTIEMYRILVQLTACSATTFFMYHSVSMFLLKNVFKRERFNFWFFYMCVFTMIFAGIILAVTFDIPEVNLDLLFQGTWISGYIAAYLYFNAMLSYLRSEESIAMSVAKMGLLFVASSHTIAIICDLTSIYPNLLTVPISSREQTFFEQVHHITRQTNLLGDFVSGIGASSLLICSYFLIRVLNKVKPDDIYFKLGIIFSLICGANDTALGAGLLTMIPCYYFGNIYETMRMYNAEIIESVEEREDLNKRILKAEDKAKTSVVLSKALRTLSHDINNALTIIRTAAELGVKITKEKSIEDLFHKVVRASNTIENISETVMTQQVNDAYEPKVELIDFNQIAKELKFLFLQRANKKDILLKIDTSEAESEFWGDKHIITYQILSNMISNSIKFSDRNSTIEMIVSIKNDICTIMVEDQGKGISKEQLELLSTSKVVTSSKGTNNENGHGLGLLIIKSNIESMNGKLKIESPAQPNNKNNPGTRITFSIPNRKKFAPKN